MDDDFNTAGALAARLRARAGRRTPSSPTYQADLCEDGPRRRCCAAEDIVVELLGVLGIEISAERRRCCLPARGRRRSRASSPATRATTPTAPSTRCSRARAAARAEQGLGARPTPSATGSPRSGFADRGHAAGRPRRLHGRRSSRWRESSRAATRSSRRCAPACRCARVLIAEGTKPDPHARRDRAPRRRGRRAASSASRDASSTRCSERGAHQGVIAVRRAVRVRAARRRARRRARRKPRSLIIALDHVTDPGNLGAVVRTARSSVPTRCSSCRRTAPRP